MIGLLLTVIVVLLVVGILLWAIQAMPWIDPGIKQAIRIIVIVIVVLWLIAALVGMVPMPALRR
ncbi:MAG TPA: Thivi_2564 family membrane protein [Terriglobia bacterium]|nr:Thivi_2564 family membrane protein [Terriglobia bacterium]